MNRYSIVTKLITSLMLVTLSACTTLDRKVDNPDRSRLGVLVISGEGLIPQYDDLRAENTWFIYSSKFAEALYSEIEKRGTKAQVYTNTDRTANPRSYVPELFSHQKRDGLIQVTITHIKNSSENTVYLSASYHALQWRHETKGDSFIAGSGPIAKFKVLGDGSDGRNTSLTVFAREFVETLYKVGYIGGE